MSHIFGYGFFYVCSYRLDRSIGLTKSCCNGVSANRKSALLCKRFPI